MDVNDNRNNESGADSPVFFKGNRMVNGTVRNSSFGKNNANTNGIENQLKDNFATGRQKAGASNPQVNAKLSENEDYTSSNIEFDPMFQPQGFFQRLKTKFRPKETQGSSGKQKIMVIMIPVLAVVFVFVLRQVFFNAPKKSSAKTKDEVTETVKNKSGNEIDWNMPAEIPDSIRDPIKVAPQANAEDPNGFDSEANNILLVKGIIFSNDKPTAFIGDRIVHLNDEINGVKVIDIDKDCVVFERDGQQWIQKVVDAEENSGYTDLQYN